MCTTTTTDNKDHAAPEAGEWVHEEVHVDDLKANPPYHISDDAVKELENSDLLLRIAPYWRYIDSFLMLLTFSMALIPLLLAKFVYGATDFQYVEIAVTALFLVMVIPFWVLMWYWYPCVPYKVKKYKRRTVDICVTMYKEDLDVVRATLKTCQRIKYPSKLLRIFALDDGRRAEVKEICDEINACVDCAHPITYVDRDSNEGRKGGNINNWIDKFSDNAGEFFIILDTDMQPFPDIIDAFFGHYYGFPEEERDSIAYIQAPQHFCNHDPKSDPFEIGMSFFYKAILPCMDALGVTMYIGTCGMWRREALVGSGKFYTTHATEDSVTGCKVHRSVSRSYSDSDSASSREDLEKQSTPSTASDARSFWISKFLRRPVAVGLSPSNLPDLFDQRVRWVVGSIEMTLEHDWFLFAKELTWVQRWAYFATSAYWLTGVISYMLMMGETVAVLFYIAVIGSQTDYADTIPFYCAVLPVLAFIMYFVLLPMPSNTEKLRNMQMFFCYAPVFYVAVLKQLGVRIKVQATAVDNASAVKRWHPLFWWHILTLLILFVGSGVALVFCHHTATNLLVVISHILVWLLIYYPVLVCLAGRTNDKAISSYYEISEI